MATGDRLGKLVCPCCGGEWTATEMKGGGTSLKCDRGFVGWAKAPRSNNGILAKLQPAAPTAPAKPAAPAPSKPAAAPAKQKRSLLATLLDGDDE